MLNKIRKSISKFDLDLDGKNVFTEAASGNYIVTSIIAALAGANVTAITKDSKYASKDEVKAKTMNLASTLNIADNINIIYSKNNIDYKKFDIVTNTGFVRPINKEMIEALSSHCVVPLMWEPWEYRKEDIDLLACLNKGIKVYGTNESDNRLRTLEYLGYIVLSFLLNQKMSPFSSKVLVIGNKHFALPIIDVLKKNSYEYEYISSYENKINITEFQAIVIAEHINDNFIIGNNAFIETEELDITQFIIHISGNINIENVKCKINTKSPAPFGYMSFTTDYIDSQAVIDLHTAGLKVAEGMIKANDMKLVGREYKIFMEKNYPSSSFEEEKYW
jgi:hypothetical protein